MLKMRIIMTLMGCVSAFVLNAEGLYISDLQQQSVYWLDSVRMENYSVVESGENHQMFILPDSVYRTSTQNVKFWRQPDFVIYYEDINLLSWMVRVAGDMAQTDSIWQSIWPEGNGNHTTRFVQPEKQTKQDRVCSFVGRKPTLFRMFLIQGSFFNQASAHSCLDCVLPKEIDFRDNNAYYRVLIPIR